MFIVYKVYAKTTPHSYYGYTRLHDIREGFLLGAQRGEKERGDVRFLALHSGDINKLMFEELETCESEMDAWMLRNDYRAVDQFAFTGPTTFPGSIAQRVAKEFPERMADWQESMVIRRHREAARTARQAYNQGVWTKDAVMGLLKKHKRDDIVRDLDFMSPSKFAEKYAM